MTNDPVGSKSGVEKKSLKKIIGFLIFILLAIGLSVLVHSFILEVAVVDGASMEPTLHPGDRLVVLKLEYLFSEPKAKDIVILRFLSDDPENFGETNQTIEYIKRIVAVPGDTIDLKYQQVFLNYEPLYENYTHGITRQKKGEYPLELSDRMFFVMGDNREYSRDSRDLGPIKQEALVGRAIFRIWPVNKLGFID